MRKAALLYNPQSGGRRSERKDDLQSVLKILTEGGVEVGLVPTSSSADASEQARKAIIEGCDTIFACGGDGTIHDVLQAVVGTRVALGVIPMGTANTFAHDLGLPLKPSKAARAALHAEPRRIAVGRLQVRGLDQNPLTRYFTVAVGIGVDAHLFYKLHAGTKQRMGMAAYYAKAWELWFSHQMEEFEVDADSGEAGRIVRENVTEMLAVRIRNFGGVLRELAPGASLDRGDIRIVMCRTASRFTYLLYVLRSLLGARWSIPGVELISSSHVRCDYPAGNGDSRRVYVEADGELVGTLPAEISIVPDALTILAPPKPQ
jgi:YegS/Rv2252/BmrU family lipid kinase